MSWILGLTSESVLLDKASFQVKDFLPANHKFVKTSRHLIYFDDKVNLVFSDSDKFIVRGLGLQLKGDKYHMMNQSDWNLFIKNPTENKISGQYLIIRWNEKEIFFSNDFFGLNTIYFYKKQNVIYYSTRLDYLCRIIESPKINFNAFAGRWLLFNQLSDEAIIEDVIKLPPNSEIKLSENRITKKTNNVLEKSDSNFNYFKTLDKHCEVVLPDSYKISLGLSGGLDSRVLLDRYLNLNKDFEIHSFGDENDKDVFIAHQIANNIKKEHHVFNASINSDIILKELSEYLALNELVDTVSTYVLTSGIKQEYFNNKLLVDGAGGELFRRQFLNRLVLKGKKELKNRNPLGIFRYINLFRADIFANEIKSKMYKASIEQISNQLLRLPDIELVGLENYVDYFAALTRFPNYYGPEQNRLNSILPNYMPFVNYELFKYLNAIPLEERRNNKMFYNLLRSTGNNLANYNLVKNGATYPFGLGTKSVFLYVKVKQKLLTSQNNILKETFYKNHKQVIIDVLKSDEVGTIKLYNLENVNNIVNKFYSGDLNYLNQIDWLFSFEIFRKSLCLNL